MKRNGESLRIPAEAYALAAEYAKMLGIPVSGAAAILIRTGSQRLEIFTAPIGKTRQRRGKPQ